MDGAATSAPDSLNVFVHSDAIDLEPACPFPKARMGAPELYRMPLAR